VLTDDVADTAIGLLLAVTRRIAVNDRFVRDSKWPLSGARLRRTASGKRLGILGLGRVGRAIARRAKGFGRGLPTRIELISSIISIRVPSSRRMRKVVSRTLSMCRRGDSMSGAPTAFSTCK
jgi:hypothetical protein